MNKFLLSIGGNAGKEKRKYVISGFRRHVTKTLALLGCYATCIDVSMLIL
jgi:hypothetical protein